MKQRLLAHIAGLLRVPKAREQTEPKKRKNREPQVPRTPVRLVPPREVIAQFVAQVSNQVVEANMGAAKSDHASESHSRYGLNAVIKSVRRLDKIIARGGRTRAIARAARQVRKRLVTYEARLARIAFGGNT